MAQIFRRESRVVLALMVGALVSFAASRAVAQDNQDTSEGVRVQLGITGGYHWFAHDLELGVPDQSGAASPKSSPAFGIRLGLMLNPMFVIEGEALLMPTHDNIANASVLLSAERIHLRFNIAPGAIAHGVVTPFILAGVGGTTVLSSKGGNGALAIQSGDTDANFYAGAGVMFALNKLLHLRIDGRVLAAPNTTIGRLLARLRAHGRVRRHAGRPRPAPTSAGRGAGQGHRRRRHPRHRGQLPQRGRPAREQGLPRHGHRR